MEKKKERKKERKNGKLKQRELGNKVSGPANRVACSVCTEVQVEHLSIKIKY